MGGRANYDKIADNQDILEIALSLGSSGYLRSGATMVWQPEHCKDWPTMLPGYPGISRKHADCDGNGLVTFSDTLAVKANYSMTHPKEVHLAAQRTAGLPDLFFDLSGISPAPGKTITVPVKLGTAAAPMAGFSGIAARLMLGGIMPALAPVVSYTGSWLGTTANTIRFAKGYNNARVDWAYARSDHRNAGGYGTIALLTFTIPTNAAGQQMKLYFDNVTIVDSSGSKSSQINILDETFSFPLGVSGYAAQAVQLRITPNPSAGAAAAEINLPFAAAYRLELREISGRLVWQYAGAGKPGLQHVSMPAAELSSGIYLMSLTCEGIRSPAPQRWVKE